MIQLSVLVQQPKATEKILARECIVCMTEKSAEEFIGINGVFIGASESYSWSTSGQIDYLFVGAVPSQGAIDGLYVYRPELSATEIRTLANI